MNNVLRTLIGFLALMLLFVGGAAVGEGAGGTIGFVLGVAAFYAIASGKAEEFYKKATS